MSRNQSSIIFDSDRWSELDRELLISRYGLDNGKLKQIIMCHLSIWEQKALYILLHKEIVNKFIGFNEEADFQKASLFCRSISTLCEYTKSIFKISGSNWFFSKLITTLLRHFSVKPYGKTKGFPLEVYQASRKWSAPWVNLKSVKGTRNWYWIFGHIFFYSRCKHY